MGNLVSDYIDNFPAQDYPDLFAPEIREQLSRVRLAFGGLASPEVIYELDLSGEAGGCDFSFRVDCPDKPAGVGEYWYELDEAACAGQPIRPCFFVDASALRPGEDNSDFLDRVLPELTGHAPWLERLRPRLEAVLLALAPYQKSLFQLGYMGGRGAGGLRIFTGNLSPEDIPRLLTALDWPGSQKALSALSALLEELTPLADKHRFILDFDVTEEGISEKLGVNFCPPNRAPAADYDSLLALFQAKGWLREEKRAPILAWLQARPQDRPLVCFDISHFKLAFNQGRVEKAKVYLRQTQFPRRAFDAWSHPRVMNLELTDRCPLRCPQCYCQLLQGRDMPMEVALRRIGQAGAAGVRVLNLSGGETLLYDGLEVLAAAGREQGLEVNIAISGWGFSRERLRSLGRAGVDNFFVSLNGSTEEVNAKTRQGYDLAITALELLREEEAPAAINWVMHSHNAGDFPHMLTLAEKYQVRELAVIVFKPDASHQLPSRPTGEQLRAVAKEIRAYKGPVQVEAEPCFSPLRALVRQGFLANTNVGPNRGCGAGIDSVSVSLEDRLTPCRHLPLEEEWPELMDYWRQSPSLKQIRQLKQEEPCSSCQYRLYCRPCLAENVKLHGRLAWTSKDCPLPMQKE